MHNTDNTCSSSSVKDEMHGEGWEEGMAHITRLDAVCTTNTLQENIRMALQLNLLKSCFTLSV